MKITILGEPLAHQSMRVTNKGHKYQSKRYLDYKAQVRAQLLKQLPKKFVPYRGPLIIKDMGFIFSPLKNMPKYKLDLLKKGGLIYKATRPDLDNLQKALLDACQGVLFLDDSQIIQYDSMYKGYGLKPRTEFEIREVV